MFHQVGGLCDVNEGQSRKAHEISPLYW